MKRKNSMLFELLKVIIKNWEHQLDAREAEKKNEKKFGKAY